MQTLFASDFDQFLMEIPTTPSPVTPAPIAQGELFARLLVRGLPVMKEDAEDKKLPTLH